MDDDIPDTISDLIEEYGEHYERQPAKPRRGVMDWLRRRFTHPQETPVPVAAKPQRPRLLAPGGLPYTSHAELLAQVEADRRGREQQAQVSGWMLVYRHKGKVIRETIPLSDAANEGEIISILFKRGVKMEHIQSLERKE